jgi:hypothetical protein
VRRRDGDKVNKLYSVYSYDAYDAPSDRRDILQGEFETLEGAVSFAKKMIDDAINAEIARGRPLSRAVESYKIAGEIPMVFGGKDPRFDAYDYLTSILER